jgi:hypothetical protein
MAGLILASAGAAIGASIGGTFLGISAVVIGQSIGAVIGSAIDNYLFAPTIKSSQEGPRLNEANVMTSVEGANLVRGYGRFKVAGNLIWATRLREEIVKETTKSGGKGGGGGGSEVTTTTYNYYANFAVGLCEGEILDVHRIWADGKLIDLSQYTYRIYKGTETQTPDSYIEQKEGEGNVPAYRGLAYVVFEDIQINRFGNRIPQMTFEVTRRVTRSDNDAVGDLVTGICLIPGTIEFGYDPNRIIQKYEDSSTNVENDHLGDGNSDWKHALDQMEANLPNVNTVCFVVSWFGDDLRIGNCTLRPKVENQTKRTDPISWRVAGLTRGTAMVISQVNGRPAYGGAPNDLSVYRAIQDLKSRGYEVMFYPFIVMDIPSGNTLPNPYSVIPETLYFGSLAGTLLNGAVGEGVYGTDIKYIPSGSSGYPGIFNAPLSDVTTGETISWAAWVRVADTSRVGLGFAETGGWALATHPVSNGTWVRVGATDTVPSGITRVDLEARYGALSSTSNLEISGLTVVRGSYTPERLLPDTDNSIGQPAYPWRGRITCSPAPGYAGTVDKSAAAGTQVSNFLGTATAANFSGSGGLVNYNGTAEWSFRRFILHYAELCRQAGGVDYFCIGTEMVEANRVRSAARTFPFVNGLISLAAQVASLLPSAKLSYAADWSEYNSYRPGDGSGDVYFHLDSLWANSNIDFIGIDNYMKLSDWRDSDNHADYGDGVDAYGNPKGDSIYDLEYLKGQVAGGEDYDYFYASTADRVSQTRTPITDGYGEHWVFRQKDIKNWWSNLHFDRYTPEPYIYTTELGEAEGYVEATFTCSEKIIKGPTTIVIDLTSISNNCAVQLYSARYGVSSSNYERIFTNDVNVVGNFTNAIHLEYEVPDEIPYLDYIFTLLVYGPGTGLNSQYVDVVFKPIARGGEFSSYIDDNGLEWRVHKFTAVNFASAGHDGVNPEPTVQNFIVNTDIKARFLIVGGGARGGDATTASTKVENGNSGSDTDGTGTSGAGSAGEAVEYKNINLEPDTYEVQVGQAGGWILIGGTYPANGSRFDYLETLGGNSGETNYSEFVGIRTGGNYPYYEYAWTISTKAGAGGEYPGAGGGDNPEPATVSVEHLFSNLTRRDDIYGDRWKMKFASGSGGEGAGGPGQLGSVIANEVNSKFYWDQPLNVLDMPDGGAGGPGIVSDITGEPVTYAEGGRGAGPAYWDPTPGGGGYLGYSNVPPSTYGSGGVGGFAMNSQTNLNERGGDGQHGVVIVSYPVEKPSPWVPESKPILFTEFGCPAINKGTNQPNVFYDSKSSESFVPYFSSGGRDDEIQRQYIRAFTEYWKDNSNNPSSSVYSGRMIDTSRMCYWSYDARPWPTFPTDGDAWADQENWQYGHWISGRIDTVYFPDLLNQLAEDYNVTADYDFGRAYGSCDGFVVQAKTSFRSTVEPLASLFLFDIIESGATIKAVSQQESRSIVTVTLDDIAEAQSDNDEPVVLTRSQSSELPVGMTIQYLDIFKDYEKAAVSQRREITESESEPSSETPVILDYTRAQQIVDRLLYSAWARRTLGEFGLLPQFLYLEAGDVVTVDDGNFNKPLRIWSIADSNYRQITARSFDLGIFQPGGGASRTQTINSQPVSIAPTAVFMDLPILRSENVAYRPYAAAYVTPWPGVNVYRSITDSNYGLDTTIIAPSVIGRTTDLFDLGITDVWDLANELKVEIFSDELSTLPEENVLNGGNALAIENSNGGWEIVQFVNAQLTGTRTYTLTKLLRGQLGTEDQMENALPAGARIVLLESTLQQLSLGINDINREYYIQYGPANRDIGDDLYRTVQRTFTGRGLRPYSPVHVGGIDEGSGNIRISWTRRTRINGDSWDYIDNVPLNEAYERYEVDVLDGSDNVVRTLTVTDATSVVYTAAQQSTDGISSPFDIIVYQLSDQVGRGIGRRTTING